MTTIFYSLSGEGLGHATRTDAILEHISEYDIHLFTWGEAYEYFKRKNYPYLHKIASIPFGRNPSGGISLWKTIKNIAKFFNDKPYYDAYVKEQIELLNPDFFICDYEPLLPRIAKKHRIPYISLDNQHKFSRGDLSELPWKYQLHGKLIGCFSELLIPRPNLAIVSSFCQFPVVYPKTIWIPPVLRPVIQNQIVGNDNFVLLYYKASCGDLLLKILRETKQKIVVYGCPFEKQIEGNIEYKQLNPDTFANDLAKCKAVFSAAGNQLLGEALYFGKPIFTIPEGQYEQIINAYYVQNLNRGRYYFPNNVSYNSVVEFLASYHPIDIDKHANGAVEAAKIIHQFKESCER